MDIMEFLRQIDGHPSKIIATPIKEETICGIRIIGWKYEIIVLYQNTEQKEIEGK